MMRLTLLNLDAHVRQIDLATCIYTRGKAVNWNEGPTKALIIRLGCYASGDFLHLMHLLRIIAR